MAATIGGTADAPEFLSASAVGNTLAISQSATSVTFDDATDPIDVPSLPTDCAADPGVSATAVTCTPVAPVTVASIRVTMGDGGSTQTATTVTAPLTIIGGAGDDNLNGGSGDDSLTGGDGNDVIDGGAGNDTINPGAGIDHVVGGSGDDSLTGGDGNDVIDGGAGNDTINPGAGIDHVVGGSGDDSLTGGDGNDVIDGGAGADVIDGEAGTDTLNGQAGDDSFTLSAGDDDINGGANDTPANIPADPNNATFGDSINAVGTADLRITLDDIADDGVAGQNANVHSDVESVFSGNGNDTITGSASANILIGGAGNDTINARDGGIDQIACGDGTPADGTADIANVDTNDTFPAPFTGDCETINRPAVDPGPGPGPVTPGPATPAATAPAATTPAATTPAPNTPSSTPALPAAKSLSLKLAPARDRSKPYKFTITGKLGLPSGVTTAKGCSGTVTLTGKRGTKTAFTKTAILKKDCTYSLKVTVKGKGKLKVTAKFGGNSVMAAKSSAALSARAG